MSGHRIPVSRLSQQPVPAPPAGATVSPARVTPQTDARSSSPDANRVPATGDQEGGLMVSVGADFFTAAELAALKLPGLPQRREHISRLASRADWTYRTRDDANEYGLYWFNKTTQQYVFKPEPAAVLEAAYKRK